MLQYNDMVQVVAAIIERKGRILIGQRMPEQSHPLKWEFPGGKLEPGETPAMAVARELEEELGIQVEASREITHYDFAYPGKNPIRLFFLRIESYGGEPVNRIFRDLRWEAKEKLGEYDFVEGDREFIDGLYTNS
jgi:8-oxo-dGTP diphosphatase